MKKLVGVGLVMLLIAVIVGCSLFDRDGDKSPTGPGSVANLGNYWVGTAVYPTLAIGGGPSAFFVNLPAAGAYAIQYWAEDAEGNRIGPLYVVVNAGGPCTVNIGALPGHSVTDVSVCPATIGAGATALQTDNGTTLYYKPDQGSMNGVTVGAPCTPLVINGEIATADTPYVTANGTLMAASVFN